jgi:hypothetical protein
MRTRSRWTKDFSPQLEILRDTDTEEFLVPADRHLDGRAIFTTDSHTGFCDNRVTEGDRVYLLAGGRVPFVLRQVGNMTSHFKVIGGAVVQGIMLGEARKPDELETIVLV